MRVVEPTLAMFVGKMQELDEPTEKVLRATEEYLKYKRDKYYGPQHYRTKDARNDLEHWLWMYKKKLSEIYDMMHDRGLTNFESGFVGQNGDGRYHPLKIEAEDEEELRREEDLAFGLIFEKNPTLIRGLENYQHAAHEGTDRNPTGEGQTASDSNGEDSEDFQSIRDATASNGSTREEEESGNWQAYTEFDLQEGFG